MFGKTRTRIRTVCAFAIVLALSALSAAAAGASRSDTVTLNVLMQATGTVPWDTVNANFAKAYPQIKINMTYAPSASEYQLLLTQLQGGNGPDLFYGSAGTGAANSLLPLVKQGYLADLSGRSWSRLMPKEFDAYTSINGKRYLFPLDIPAITIMYNPTLMKQYGFTVPDSFAKLLTLCKAARAKGASVLTIAGTTLPNIGLTADALAATYVYAKDPGWDAKKAAGKVTFAGSPLWTDALTHFVAMFQNGCYQPGAEGANGNSARGLFANGQALGEVLTTAARPQLLAVNATMPLAMAPFPADKPGVGYVWVGATDSLAVNAHSSHLKEALTYIDFLARTGQSRLMARLQGGFSWNDYKHLVSGTLKNADLVKAGFDWASGIMPALDAKHGVFNALYGWPDPTIATALQTGIQGLMTGQKTIPQVLSDLDAAWAAVKK